MRLPSSPPSHQPHHRAASFALAVGVFGVGWSAIFVRWSGVSGMVSAFYRLLFAALVLVPWYVVHQRTRGAISRTSKWHATIAGVVFATDLAFFNSSIMITSAANATLLSVNAPVFVAIGVWLLYGERPTTRFWLGFGLALSGVISIVGTDVVLHPKLGFGDSLAVAGALCYGVYLLYVPRIRAEMDTLAFSTWAVSAGAISLLPVCLLARQPLSGFGAQSWAALIGLALATQLMGHFCIAYALGHLNVTMSSIVLLAQAPLTALLAWPLLGERIGIAQIVGGALVLAGIVVVNSTRRAPRLQESAVQYDPSHTEVNH